MPAKNVNTNQFGEVAIETQSDAQALATVNNQPAKAAVTALTPLADPSTATTTQIGTLLNALLVALKTVS